MCSYYNLVCVWLGVCETIAIILMCFQAEQHFLKHNETGSWVQDSALMLSMSKEVPWFLVSQI